MAWWRRRARSAGAAAVAGLLLLALRSALAGAPAAFALHRAAAARLARLPPLGAGSGQRRASALAVQPLGGSLAGVAASSLVAACLAFAAARSGATLAASLRFRSQRCTAARGRVRLAAAGAEGSPFRVLVPVANDSEEIETACITDVLTRAGAEVTVASVEPELQVRMSRGLKVVADVLIGDCMGQQWDVIACPGGMPGAERLRDSEDLTKLLTEQRASGRLTAAVCASPAVIFATHGLIDSAATSYPAPQFKELVGDSWTDAKAVVDGNVITSQGPGTSLQFALKIVENLYGLGKAKELASQMITQVA